MDPLLAGALAVIATAASAAGIWLQWGRNQADEARTVAVDAKAAALDVAANIQAAFTAQATLIKELQVDNDRIRSALRASEALCDKCRALLSEAQQRIDQLESRVAHLEQP